MPENRVDIFYSLQITTFDELDIEQGRMKSSWLLLQELFLESSRELFEK